MINPFYAYSATACPLIFACRLTDPSAKYVEGQQMLWSLFGVSVGGPVLLNAASANVHNKINKMSLNKYSEGGSIS